MSTASSILNTVVVTSKLDSELEDRIDNVCTCLGFTRDEFEHLWTVTGLTHHDRIGQSPLAYAFIKDYEWFIELANLVLKEPVYTRLQVWLRRDNEVFGHQSPLDLFNTDQRLYGKVPIRGLTELFERLLQGVG